MSFLNLINHAYDLIKRNFVLIFLAFFWLILLGAVNSKPEHITDLIIIIFPQIEFLSFDEYQTFKKALTPSSGFISIYINFFRALGPLFVMVVSLFLIFYLNAGRKIAVKDSFFIVFCHNKKKCIYS